MTSHYVSGLFDSSGIIVYVLQRLGLIDVGAEAVTTSHNVTIQFSSATKTTGMYHYIILNVWLMPWAFQLHKHHWPEARSIAYSAFTSLTTMANERGQRTVCYSPCFWSLVFVHLEKHKVSVTYSVLCTDTYQLSVLLSKTKSWHHDFQWQLQCPHQSMRVSATGIKLC